MGGGAPGDVKGDPTVLSAGTGLPLQTALKGEGLVL